MVAARLASKQFCGRRAKKWIVFDLLPLANFEISDINLNISSIFGFTFLPSVHRGRYLVYIGGVPGVMTVWRFTAGGVTWSGRARLCAV